MSEEYIKKIEDFQKELFENSINVPMSIQDILDDKFWEL